MTTIAVLPTSVSVGDSNDIENNNTVHDQNIPTAQVSINNNITSNNSYGDIPVVVATAIPITQNGWISPRGWNNGSSQLNSHVLPDCVGDESLTDRQIFLIGVHRITKLVKVISFIEISLIVIIGIVLPIYFIVLPFPLAGYFGSRRYSTRLLYCYLIYIALNFLGGIISIFFIRNLLYIVFRLIYLSVNVTIFRYIVRLCGYIYSFNDDDYDFVYNSAVIQNIDRSTMC